MRSFRQLTLAALSALSLVGCSLNAPKPWSKAEDRVAVTPREPASRPNRVAADACFATATELEAAGKEAEAVLQYERAAKFGYDQHFTAHRIAVCYDRIGDKQALAAFEKAISLNPKSADVYCDYGFHLYGQAKLPDAETTLKRALELDPRHKRAGVNLALVYGEQKRYEDAFRQFEKYVGAAAAHANVGVLMARHGNSDQARLAFERAQTMDPTLKQPKQLLEHLTALNASSDSATR